jgi:regulator of cell morphogenesis and NO signaling
MLLIYKNMPLGALINSHTSIVPVLDRMGINLGVGDSTVEEVCMEKGINVDFVIAILNTFLNEGYFPEKSFQTVSREDIESYMNSTYEYYLGAQLPVIEAHLMRLINGENAPLHIIKRMVEDIRLSIINAMGSDKKTDYATSDEYYQGAISLIDDVKNLIIKHISGRYDKNMCYALLFFLSSFRKDLNHHLRIRSRVLIPMMK